MPSCAAGKGSPRACITAGRRSSWKPVRRGWRATPHARPPRGERGDKIGEGATSKRSAPALTASPRWLLIVDEIGYLPVVPDGGSLFFQLVNARYERGAMILTSNRGFAECGEIFGDPVVATALLDRLLHHAVVIQIEGSSYRLRQHAELVPEHIRSKALINPPLPAPRRRGRPPKPKDPPAGEPLIDQAVTWGNLLRRF